MGWDAYATREGRGLDPGTDAAALRAFHRASAEVARDTGCVDAQLEDGRLDCQACRVQIELATREMAGNIAWSADQLRERVKAATWPEGWELEEGDEWAAASARRFLEICAEFGLGAQFC